MLSPGDKITGYVTDLNTGEVFGLVNMTLAEGVIAYVGLALVLDKHGKVYNRVGLYKLNRPTWP